MNWRPVLRYFASPFPSMKGFSPYRMPGPIFHLSVAALIAVIGLALCLPGSGSDTAPLLTVWVIAGFYFGRDLAIFAHYIGLLTLAWLAAVIAVLVFPELLNSLHRTLATFSNENYPQAAVAASAVLAAGFALWVKWRTREPQD